MAFAIPAGSTAEAARGQDGGSGHRAMTDASALANQLDRLGEARVLVVGDVMLDRYVYGTVERISPEAPIPVLRIERDEAMLGGAGNVLRNLGALGARATLVAVVGDDPPGAEIAALIDAEPRARATLLTVPGRRTTVKTRHVAGGQQLFRTDLESVEPLDGELAERLLASVESALDEHDAVVLSDYAKGVLSEAALEPVIARVRERGKPLVADPKSRDFGRYRGVSLLTPNRAELAAATGLSCVSDDEVAAAARRVIERHGVDAVLVTLSERGMSLISNDGAALRLEAEAREVFDVTGAGDSVVAALAAALAAGFPLAAAVRLANLAGGLAVAKLGTAVVHRDELAGALHAEDMKSTEAKICTLGMARERVARWRHRGERVGFTNGCFDLIHPGHVSLLTQAKGACDRLVVGLNSDESVRRLKGDKRPIQSEGARAAVLASLGMVDAVVIFAEDTPLELIRALRPDVLVKGADYALAEVVGAELVQAYGGDVLLADIVPGHSTTGTIAKLVG